MSYTEHTVPQMKTMAKDYAQRVFTESTQVGSDVKLPDEYIMLKLDKTILDTMLKASKADGLLAIFGLDNSGNEKQSVILVPCDKNNNALKYGGNTVIKGAECWQKNGRNMNDVIYPGGTTTPDIPQGIDNVFGDANM